jgi:hypothetical protein
MLSGKPAPVGRALIAVVDEASREQRPSHGLSARQRTWRACGVPAVLVTNASGGARVARARRGPSALPAVSWRLRHRQRPWAERLVARGRGILRPDGSTAGRRVRADTDNPRSTAAKALAPLDHRRDHDRGGDRWGPRRGLLWVGTPHMAIPVGLAFSQPAPARSAWSQTEQALKQPGVATPQRPPHPPATPA